MPTLRIPHPREYEAAVDAGDCAMLEFYAGDDAARLSLSLFTQKDGYRSAEASAHYDDGKLIKLGTTTYSSGETTTYVTLWDGEKNYTVDAELLLDWARKAGETDE